MPTTTLSIEAPGSSATPMWSTGSTVIGDLVDASIGDLARLTPEWRQLVAVGPYAEPFFQPYWFDAFANSFRGDSPLTLVTARQGARLIGILPLMRARRFFDRVPARTLTSLAGIHSCRFDFIVEPDKKIHAAQAAWRALREDSSWAVLEAYNVPTGGAFEAVMAEAARDGFFVDRWPTLFSPYLELPKRGSEPLANCPARYRSNRGRFENHRKKLRQRGPLSFTVTTQFTHEIFERFLSLESAGWKGAHGSAIACNQTTREFYRRMLPAAAAAGHLRLNTLELGGRAIAMDMGLLTNGRWYFSPKVAYDEQFAKYSPGHALNLFVIADLVNNGVERYDFLGARARHKYIWAGEHREHARCFIFRPSVAGRLRHAVMRHFAPRVRRLKHSLFGDPQALSQRS